MSLRIPFDDLRATLAGILRAEGFSDVRAARCAGLFAEASRDGVASHGVNRFTRFVETVRNGTVRPEATPVCRGAFGAFEQWDGGRGSGNLNAEAAMARAVDLAGTHGIGGVALRETNHWMRGGAYGWQAAEAGCLGICWTNTMPNLPLWGARDARVGNNPLVLAVPRAAGHVVFDGAMSQFSYGALRAYADRGASLPVPGGYDPEGRLTDDPAAIEASGRPLPMGFWKGSGLALLLDLAAALLSGGRATHEIAPDPLHETGLSQVFLACAVGPLQAPGAADALADAVIAHLHASDPVPGGAPVRYPGERVLAARADSLRNGVPVDAAVWQRVGDLT